VAAPRPAAGSARTHGRHFVQPQRAKLRQRCGIIVAFMLAIDSLLKC